MTGISHCSVMQIFVTNLTIIGSDNGLSPGQRQAIIWTNAGMLLIWTLRTNFTQILITIHTFSFKKMHLKMTSGKCRPGCRPFYLSLNVIVAVTIAAKWHPLLIVQYILLHSKNQVHQMYCWQQCKLKTCLYFCWDKLHNLKISSNWFALFWILS